MDSRLRRQPRPSSLCRPNRRFVAVATAAAATRAAGCSGARTGPNLQRPNCTGTGRNRGRASDTSRRRRRREAQRRRRRRRRSGSSRLMRPLGNYQCPFIAARIGKLRLPSLLYCCRRRHTVDYTAVGISISCRRTSRGIHFGIISFWRCRAPYNAADGATCRQLAARPYASASVPERTPNRVHRSRAV